MGQRPSPRRHSDKRLNLQLSGKQPNHRRHSDKRLSLQLSDRRRKQHHPRQHLHCRLLVKRRHHLCSVKHLPRPRLVSHQHSVSLLRLAKQFGRPPRDLAPRTMGRSQRSAKQHNRCHRCLGPHHSQGQRSIHRIPHRQLSAAQPPHKSPLSDQRRQRQHLAQRGSRTPQRQE